LTDNNEYAFFNQADVDSILFIGYINAAEQKFAESYDEMIAKSGYEKLSL